MSVSNLYPILCGLVLAIQTTSFVVGLPQSLHGPDGPWYLLCPSEHTQSKACKFLITGIMVQLSCILSIILTSNPSSKAQCASNFIMYLAVEILAPIFVAAL